MLKLAKNVPDIFRRTMYVKAKTKLPRPNIMTNDVTDEALIDTIPMIDNRFGPQKTAC